MKAIDRTLKTQGAHRGLRGIRKRIGWRLALPATMIGKRDRAILLLGFAGGFRRSEPAAIGVEDCAKLLEGIEDSNDTGGEREKH